MDMHGGHRGAPVGSIMPAAIGLAAAITASWGYEYLSARMADFDIEMRNAAC